MKKAWIGLAALVGIGCAVMGVMIIKRPPMKVGVGFGTATGRSIDEQIRDAEKVDPKQILCREAGRYATGIAKPTGLATGPDDRIYVVGDKALVILGTNGAQAGRVELGQAPLCVAVGPDSTVYVGMMDHVEVLDANGARKSSWPPLSGTGWITSIAAGANEIYVADFGSKRVMKYDKGGKILLQIGAEGPDRGRFELPSPNFDVAVDKSGKAWVVEPGKHFIYNIREDGSLGSTWGRFARLGEIEGFSGCCNPTHIAARPDGSFITSEKGIVRVKIHGSSGEFLGVVAQASDFKKDIHGLDLAVDSKDRMLVLDPETATVRVFVLKGDSNP